MNGTLELSEVNKAALVCLCQQVMTQDVVMTQTAFTRRFNKFLTNEMNPLVVQTIKDSVDRLYAFLETTHNNPMRVALSHAMKDVFLGFVTVSSSDITNMLMKYNEKFLTQRYTGNRGNVCVHTLHLGAIRGTSLSRSFKLSVPFSCRNQHNDNVFVDMKDVLKSIERKRIAVLSAATGERMFGVGRDLIHPVRSLVGRALIEYRNKHPDVKAACRRAKSKGQDRFQNYLNYMSNTGYQSDTSYQCRTTASQSYSYNNNGYKRW